MSYNNCQFTWLKQKETLVSLAESLLKDGEYFDCQLCAEGHHFNVHRVILSCNSPVFGNILQEHNSDLPVITLEGISFVELGALVEFMYTGVTRISPNFLRNFFQTAKSLQLAGLSHYDSAQIDKILSENGASTFDTEFQSNYEAYSQNILHCLDQSDTTKDMTSLSSSSIFLGESSETVDLVNDSSGIYEKYQIDFIKEENDDIDETLESHLGENDDLSQTCDEDASNLNEIEESNIDNSIIYKKLQNVFMKHENKTLSDNLTTVYSISNVDDLDSKQEDELIELQEELKVTNEDEDFVYVKLDNDTLDRLREGQAPRSKQNTIKSNIKFYPKKCLRMINPIEKNFIIKRPKIQNLEAKDAKNDSEDKKIYICLKCGNKYSHRRTLLHHIHWICEQPATYSCSLCPYRGKRKFQLKSHMKHAHLLKMRKWNSAKAEFMEDQCKEIKKLEVTGRYDLLYKEAKQFEYKALGQRAQGIEDENGNYLIESKEILGRWKEYVDELYEAHHHPIALSLEQENEVNKDEKEFDLLRSEFDQALKEIRHFILQENLFHKSLMFYLKLN